MPVVIKKDGRREAYSRDKVLGGIQKACQKRSITVAQTERIVIDIEKRLQSYGLKEVPARTIGQNIMVGLHRLDKVAYVRFASVYRDFQDVEEFVADLQSTPEIPPEEHSSLSFPFFSNTEDDIKKTDKNTSKIPTNKKNILINTPRGPQL